jgi:hypothetical protein
MNTLTPPIAHSPSKKWFYWAVTLLSLPALIPLAGALIVPLMKNRVPTGFIEYDMPYYLANGRSYFYHGFHLTYSNPYAGYGSPAIYFQPQTLLLGLIQQLGFHPGVTFNIVELLALFFASSVAVILYMEVVGAETTAKKLGLVCFFWGGGVFTLIGLALTLARGEPLLSVFEFEPTWGWWMLNFGRNLVYPTEAYYHGVYLLSLLFLVRKRFMLSLLMAALLCASHPFTGVSLILVLIAYSALELVLRSGAVPFQFMLGAILIAALDVGYYLVWLNRFSDHRAVQAQMSAVTAAWLYRPKTFIAALLIVGCLAIWRIASTRFSCFRDSRTRLFAVLFLVVFALTQHNLFMGPMEPIHFAHGYDWIALFFIGAPMLIALLDYLLRLPGPWLRTGALTLLMIFFLLDNAAWLVKIAIRNEFLVSLSREESGALSWLGHNVKQGDMVICEDVPVSYLVSTYTPGRSWYGHEKNTPYMQQRQDEVNQAFSEGIILPEWKKQGVYFVSPANWVPPAQLPLKQLYANTGFSIWAAQ